MDINDLYHKVKQFQDSQSETAKTLSNCKDGCSRCCYVDLSIFEVEANNIRSWFKRLNITEKEKLKVLWNSKLTTMENFEDESVESCIFLRNESCSIYAARPLICRTQGLAFKFKLENDVYHDICPLNDSLLEQATDSDILNLDLLNIILGQLESTDAQNTTRSRVSLNKLFKELNLL